MNAISDLSREDAIKSFQLKIKKDEDFINNSARKIIWRRISEISSGPIYTKGRCCGYNERPLTDLECVEEINRFNEDLYERLEARKRAIGKWKRLKIVIVILKMTGGRIDDSS